MMGKLEHHTIENPEIVMCDTDLDRLKGDLHRMALDGKIKEFEYLGPDDAEVHQVRVTMVEPVSFVKIAQTLHK